MVLFHSSNVKSSMGAHAPLIPAFATTTSSSLVTARQLADRLLHLPLVRDIGIQDVSIAIAWLISSIVASRSSWLCPSKPTQYPSDGWFGPPFRCPIPRL